MAHVVGVPRRDPCNKCQLPVFLAERLTVGKKVYHRTCLKCARCGSQLTLGSFYETEVDDVYCCETCPDEEEMDDQEISGAAAAKTAHVDNNNLLRDKENISAHKSEGAEGATSVRPARSSIADRLAFFEQSNSGNVSDRSNVNSIKLLQKSMSDEEKTKGIRKLEEETTASSNVASYKMNKAFSSFLNDELDADENSSNKDELVSESTSITADRTETSMETSDSESADDDESDAKQSLSKDELKENVSATPAIETKIEKEDEPPALPQTPVPETLSDEQRTPAKRFTATAQLQLNTSDNSSEVVANEEAEATKDKANNNKQQPLIEADELKVEKEEKEEEPAETATISVEENAQENKRVDVSEEEHEHVDIAKDKASIAMEDEETVEMRSQSTEPQVQTVGHAEDKATTDRLSVVRARLQQFEVIANSKTSNNDIEIRKSPEKEVSLLITTTPELSKPAESSTSDTILEEKVQGDKEAVVEKMQTDIQDNKVDASIAELPKVEDASMETAIESKLAEAQSEVPCDDKAGTGNGNSESLKASPVPSPRLSPKITPQASPRNMHAERTESKSIVIPPTPPVPATSDEPKLKTAESQEQKSKSKHSSLQPSPQPSRRSSGRVDPKQYNEDLNPFKSDDDEDENGYVEGEYLINKENFPQTSRTSQTSTSTPRKSVCSVNTNPFDSDDDEVELEKSSRSSSITTPNGSVKVPPPRPPPPRISRNPFGEEDEENEDQNFLRQSSLTSSGKARVPVPTPRTNLAQSQTTTPEPTPRLSNKLPSSQNGSLQNSTSYYGSANSLSTTPLHRNSDMRGSNNSLTSSSGGTIRSRKNRRAPAPPGQQPALKELFPSTETMNSSKASTPSSSTVGTPKIGRKKRPAPAPPKPARLDPNLMPQITLEHATNESKNLHSYPLQSGSNSKLSDEEKALLEGNKLLPSDSSKSTTGIPVESNERLAAITRRNTRRLIPLDPDILKDENDENKQSNGEGQCDDQKSSRLAEEEEEANVVYRRILMPPAINTPTHEANPLISDLQAQEKYDRQSEKLKDNKEALNRNRQSQFSTNSSGAEDSDATNIYNKAVHGKWKRRKGPAPALPIPPRRVLQMLPLQEIRHELDIIEVQQQGLEKQGVILEKMIRDRCEGQNGEMLENTSTEDNIDAEDGLKTDKPIPGNVQNSKEVEDLILQLFELVNEKNELFRRQAELMYLRRQHRLEQEQADLEYEIRVLMAQPECNKTDSDKSREEALIARLVEVVQLRNEVVECLEMDRLREAEEDMSIKQRLEQHTAHREGGKGHDDSKKSSKLSKKEKKKQKEAKKLSKTKKVDAEKDADETELGTDKQKLKKKKRKFLF